MVFQANVERFWVVCIVFFLEAFNVCFYAVLHFMTQLYGSKYTAELRTDWRLTPSLNVSEEHKVKRTLQVLQ